MAVPDRDRCTEEFRVSEDVTLRCMWNRKHSGTAHRDTLMNVAVAYEWFSDDENRPRKASTMDLRPGGKYDVIAEYDPPIPQPHKGRAKTNAARMMFG